MIAPDYQKACDILADAEGKLEEIFGQILANVHAEINAGDADTIEEIVGWLGAEVTLAQFIKLIRENSFADCEGFFENRIDLAAYALAEDRFERRG